MPFDPSKAFEVIEAAAPASAEAPKFDPMQPHEVVAPPPAFDPAQPHEVVSATAPAPAFDPSQPHEVIATASPSGGTWQNPFKPLDEGPVLKAFQDQMASARGPLERVGLFLKHFAQVGYGKSVDQSFEPGKGQPQLPTVDSSKGGAPAQVGKELYNTGAGAINALPTGGGMSVLLNPLAAAYAAPHFAKQAWDSAPRAFESFFDPNATAADRTRNVAATVLNALAAFGLTKKATGAVTPAVNVATRLPETVKQVMSGGSYTPPRATPIETLADSRTAAGNLWRSGKVRDAIAYTRDVADTRADNVANVTSNDIRGPLRRTFGKDAPKAETALSFVVEAMNDPAALDAARQKIIASDRASPQWRQTALEAIDFAQKNFDKLKPAAEAYSERMLKQWEGEQAAGQDTPFHAGYVMHVQDLADPAGFETINGGGSEGSSAFRKMRVHDTFADSIAAGIDPKTLNAVDLMRSRLANGQKLINRNLWVDSLKEMKDPTNKQPIIMAPETVTRPDGSTYSNAPQGYRTEIVGNRPVAVQQGYAGLFDAMTKPSAFAQETFGPVLQKANATGKSVNLLFDTFHLGRIAMWDSAIKAAGVKTFKAPIPSYKQGVTLLDHSAPEIVKMAQAGEVPQRWLPKLLENKKTLDLLVNHGMNTGRVADAMHQEWVRKIPGIGNFNKFVFERFQRGAMSEIGLLEYERQRAMYPELKDSEVARKVAKDVNTRFGNFGRQGWAKGQTAQDVARLIALAPQWNEGLIKSEAGAIRQGYAAGKDLLVNRRFASGMLARGTATMMLSQFVANQMLNYYTRGHPTWKNPEEGVGAKLSAWIPDKIGGGPGFFLNPLGLAAEVTHLFSQHLEKNPDWQKAIESYARSRASAVMKPIAVALTGRDGMGRPLRPSDKAGAIAKEAVPLPIASGALYSAAKEAVTKQPSESFPGQYQKQLMAAGGVKTDSAPSAEQRIGHLAKEFNAKKGITPSAEFYAGDFEDYTNALRIGNQDDAKAALRDLLQKKTRLQISQHYERQMNAPFTGQMGREAQFRMSLSAEQKQAYTKARADRMKLGQAAMRALQQYLSPNTN